MIIAIPITDGKLSLHFGHCENFALFDADPENRTIVAQDLLDAPSHQPGMLPAWLADKGATVIIAGGMGRRAQGLFEQQGIKVVVGAPSEAPEKIVANYLEGTLRVGVNACDH